MSDAGASLLPGFQLPDAGAWLLSLGAWKPVLTALVLPPTLPMLVLLAGFWLLWRARPLVYWPGRLLVFTGFAALWLLSCQSVAVWLDRTLLPQYPAQTAAQLQQRQIQAVVVLGGGISVDTPEYAGPQLNAMSMERLRYGALLARALKLPLGYAGGVGWGNADKTSAGTLTAPLAEATLAEQAAPQTYGISVAFADARSRDTRENGENMAQLLRERGITRIALVTHAWHMPRSMAAFAGKGLDVVPAPMGFTGPYERPLLDALPSGHGLAASRRVLREWLGLRLGAH